MLFVYQYVTTREFSQPPKEERRHGLLSLQPTPPYKRIHTSLYPVHNSNLISAVDAL